MGSSTRPCGCSTGVCGPTIDPALLDLQQAILKRRLGAAVLVEQVTLLSPHNFGLLRRLDAISAGVDLIRGRSRRSDR